MKRVVFASIIVIAFLAEFAWLSVLAGVASLTKDASPVEIVAFTVATNFVVMIAVAIAVLPLAELLADDRDPFGGAR